MPLEPIASSPKVLLVCKGNICRSAAAEAVMKNLSSGRLAVRSRGTRGWHEGKGASEMMRSIAIERGYDMEKHIARQVTEADLRWATHVFVFDQEGINAIRGMFPGFPSGVLRLFKIDGSDVPDPYGHDEPVFQNCFNHIEAGAKALLESLCSGEGLQ